MQRRAASETDRDFFFSVRREGFRQYVDELSGWDDAEQRRQADREFGELPIEIMAFASSAPTTLGCGWSGPRDPSRGSVPLVQQRVSLVTLGVGDLARARAFYEALGWKTNAQPEDDVIFFQTGGMIVALWSREQLAEDSGVADSGGWGGVTLACNVRSPEEADAVLEEARAAGARIAREGGTTFWGGYSGVFVDPDGHPWEVAHNPHWTVADDGSVRL
jgi:predicted lactoylglutathione lyase